MSENTETNQGGSSRSNSFLRVDSEKVTNLMDVVGELGLSLGDVLNHPELKGCELERFWLSANRLTLLIQETQDIASSLSLVPLKTVFSRMRRLARELASQTGKPFNLDIIGEGLEVDKSVVDRLYDPLVHIVRNSADHGLETPEKRAESGKPATGTITIEAVQHGSEIHINIKDDGQGLNREKILAQARKRGLVGENEEPPDQTVWGFIFKAGFSTAETVSTLSGRGVGMDVVNSTIESFRGNLSVTSEEGKGTQVTLKIPLSLAFLECFVVKVGTHFYAVPIDAVSEVFRPVSAQVTVSSASNDECLMVRERLLPVHRMQHFYGRNDEGEPLTQSIVVVGESSSGPFCIPVDELLGQQIVTMKPLNGLLSDIRGSLGCALLNTGEVAIVIDCERVKAGISAE